MAATSGYYTYFISSLPMLQFGAKPLFSFEDFLGACRSVISETDIGLLRKISENIWDGDYGSFPEAEKKWRKFETVLRNELVRIRASRKHLDASKFLREDGYAEPTVSNAVMNAYKNPSILDREKTLDLERWRALDEISGGHYFDIDALVVYARKLLILERWAKIARAESEKLLEETLEKAGKN